MTPDLAFNTSVSFETNTNWQNYSGETGASYLTQMTVLAVRNFTSAATGMAIAIALIRGLVRRSSKTIGNFWVDLTRGVLYILLPIAVVFAVDPRLAGRPPDARRPADRHDPPGRPADDRPRADRLAGDHQGARQQRRRVHQRQLRPPVREPDPADELPRDARDVRDPVLADLHVRPDGRQPAPGLGDLRRRWRRSSSSAPSSRCTTRRVGNPLFPAGVDQALGNMEGKEVRFGAAVGGALGGDHDRARAPARSTPGTTASSRSPASSRCSTWSSARSPRAASAPGCTGCSSSARSCRSSSPG